MKLLSVRWTTRILYAWHLQFYHLPLTTANVANCIRSQRISRIICSFIANKAIDNTQSVRDPMCLLILFLLDDGVGTVAFQSFAHDTQGSMISPHSAPLVDDYQVCKALHTQNAVEYDILRLTSLLHYIRFNGMEPLLACRNKGSKPLTWQQFVKNASINACQKSSARVRKLGEVNDNGEKKVGNSRNIANGIIRSVMS